MAPLMIPTRRLILFLVLIQLASPYKIYALDDNHSDLSSNLLSSPLNRDINQEVAIKNLESNNDEDMIGDENQDNSASWLSSISQMRQHDEPVWKRSGFPVKLYSSIALPQRRNNRPHWNPLVAAYKRCGELLRREDRESCFKDAIQMLFVHKLKK